MMLSVLIPSTPDRRDFLARLFDQFHSQLEHVGSKTLLMWHGGNLHTEYFIYKEGILSCEVEILTFEDDKILTIGRKRNKLLEQAVGMNVEFIDSDDRISDNHFKLIMEGMKKGVDCCSLKGVITEDGQNPLVFEHSVKYKEYKTNPEGMPVRYERYPNHLNCIKSGIAKQFKFPEKNHGEDTDWATQIFKSGLIKTEYYIDEVLYYYDHRSNK